MGFHPEFPHAPVAGALSRTIHCEIPQQSGFKTPQFSFKIHPNVVKGKQSIQTRSKANNPSIKTAMAESVQFDTHPVHNC